MPSVEEYQIPTEGIDRISKFIIEIGRRYSNLEEGIISEGTFQSEIIGRKGGTYSRYKYDMNLYGFIERIAKGQIRITKLFLDIANPLREEDREKAKLKAVRNIQLFKDMYEYGFKDTFSEDDLRMWLVEKKDVPRSKIDKGKLELIRKLYIEAYPYLRETKEVSSVEKESSEIQSLPAARKGTELKGVEQLIWGDVKIQLPPTPEAVEIAEELLQTFKKIRFKKMENQTTEENSSED